MSCVLPMEEKVTPMDLKLFSDAVHGPMTFHPLVVVVIDTRQMQRLRGIKQLGGCSFLFPSAVHSRFEHSLGTAYIAGRLFDSLKLQGLPSDITEEQWERKKLCVEIAGLCHDLGHGPFSHLWECFRRRCNDNKWRHEVESISIFDELLQEEISPTKSFGGQCLATVRDAFTYYGLSQVEIELIKEMIIGNTGEDNYLYQVISNKRNDIDVDKWEYITRDSHMLSVPVGFDLNRLINYCKIMADNTGKKHICFREEECNSIVEMFLARGLLHDKCYQHEKVKIVEEMLLDAFMFARKRLKLLETPICELSDYIYYKILFDDFGVDEDMEKAREILRRLEKRHLYQCVCRQTIQGKSPKLSAVITYLKSVPDLLPYLDNFGLTIVSIDMTKANRKKELRNIMVYNKPKLGEQEQCCKVFEWDKYEDTLKYNLGSLKRRQVFLLYKGTQVFPQSLIPVVEEKLKLFFLDEAD